MEHVEFSTPPIHLDLADLRYGYLHGYLTEGDVVRSATRAWEAGQRSQQIEALMSLLRDEYESVPDLLVAAEAEQPGTRAAEDRARRKWICIRLSGLLEAHLPLSALFEQVDALHADNDYPSYMDSLVSYTPVASADEGSPDKLFRRIVDYVEAEQTALS